MRVLIIEDERDLAAAIARGLRRDGMAVDESHDGEDGLEKALINEYDVVILDRNLPRLHGDEVCRSLRAEGVTARVIMLTAAAEVADRVAGLTLGADDYLPKPFAFDELRARVLALARRGGAARPPVLKRAGVRLDPATREVQRDGRRVELSPKEFGVLEALLASDGAVVSAEALLERVWDEHVDPFSNVVRVTIMTLRKRLGEPAVIETVVGAGYRVS
ncbi:MAG: DNA-binding response regulator [Chloroflexi bacterium HGW-Chloroflexi-9]|nr:MAG: DNA-binding response regulator [Chloroflexi bacterium HGW-Chloroflexi-9]